MDIDYKFEYEKALKREKDLAMKLEEVYGILTGERNRFNILSGLYIHDNLEEIFKWHVQRKK